MPKTSPEVIACGCVDELNAVLGMVRVSGVPESIVDEIDIIQQHLVSLMGLLSVPAEKRQKYLADGYPSISDKTSRTPPT